MSPTVVALLITVLLFEGSSEELLDQNEVINMALSDKYHEELYEADISKELDNIFLNLYVNGAELGLTPLLLPNVTKDFSEKLWLVTVGGFINLTNGSLTGASLILRKNVAMVNYDRTTKLFSVEGEVEFPDLEVMFDMNLEAGPLNPQGTLKGSLKEMYAEFKMVLDVDKMALTLTKFDFPNIGSIDITIDVNFIYNTVVDTISELVTKVFKIPLTILVENVIKNKVQEIINEFL